MAKNSISEYSATASLNTDIGGIGLVGTVNPVSNLDDALRELMSQLKDMYDAPAFGGTGLGLGTSAEGFWIGRNDNDGLLGLQGDAPGTAGAGGKIHLYSTGHATKAKDIEYFSNNVTVYKYDASAGWHFWNDDITIGQELTQVPGTGNNHQGCGFLNSNGGFYGNVNGASHGLGRCQDGAVVVWNSGGTTRGSVSISGATTSYNTTSDKRLKEALETFDAGPILDALEVWKFRWKEFGTVGYGVMAQDAKPIFPQAITHDKDTDKWQADYSAYVPLLLAEVKALRERVAALEAGN